MLTFEHDTVVDNLRAIADEEPTRLFVKLLRPRADPQVLTFAELLAEASPFAALYERRGVKPGDVVILILEQDLTLLQAFVGAVLYGAVPSIFAFPSAKIPAAIYDQTLAEMLEVCATPYLVTSAELAGRLGDSVRARMQLILSSEAGEVETGGGGYPSPTPEATVLLQHSSGTTGLKKGVALSNRAVIQQLRHLGAALALSREDKIASWLPLYHDMGLIACLLLPLASGVPVVMMSPFDWIADPAMLLRAITQERTTLCWLPNFAYELLATRLTDKKLEGVDLGSARAFINCAEPVSADSHARFMRRFAGRGLRASALAASYAMAENTFAVTQGGIHAPLAERPIDWGVFAREQRAAPPTRETQTVRTLVSSGRVLEGNEVRIVDGDRRELPAGRVGEIAIRSDSLMSGYFQRPELTAAAMAGGWYYTGDLGFVLEGELFVTGRHKDMIIVAGKNIYPQDVEAIVSEISGIYPGRVVAFGVTNEAKGTEDLIVVAETRVSAAAEISRLRLAIAEALRYRLECIVDDILLVEHMWLHKSSSGKIARKANREKYLETIRSRA